MRFEDCRFGLVVRHWSYGLGMIEVLVPKTQTVNVCFETECVNMSPFDLELLGDIRIFEWVPKLAKAAEKLAISDSGIHDQS
jgi:hypothetical protein